MSADAPVILFVKAPVPGQVKSRLAGSLGGDAALELYRSFALDLLDTIDSCGHPVEIFFTPSGARKAVVAWLGEGRRYALQTGRELGSRMANAFRTAFTEGAARAILIGSDLPDLPGEVITDAFAGLQEQGAVIGPAVDGGYYLIGFRNDTFWPDVFNNIRWSTGSVFRETMERFAGIGSRVYVMRQWQDVDTAEDLRSLRRRSAGTSFEDSRTMHVFRKHCGTM